MPTLMISPPVAEPVTLEEMLLQLGIVAPSDGTLEAALAAQVSRALLAARRHCENYTRSVYVTQKWKYLMDGWPCHDGRYDHGGLGHGFYLPKPPFQSIEFLQYVDIGGAVQLLTLDASYGSSVDAPVYGYQLDRGGETQPARLFPPWVKPWPPIRRAANAVAVQFKCGFGGPVAGTVAEGSSILTGPVFLPQDVTQPVIVRGAAGGGKDLVTSIVAVDEAGEATLADNAVAVGTEGVPVYVGQPVPEEIRQAIMFMAQFFYEQGATVDLPTPRIVRDLLDPCRNLVG